MIRETMDFNLTTHEGWVRMAAACHKAKRTIDFEQYIVRNDPAGLNFLNLLADRARDGLRVRIILDAYGSRSLKGAPILTELEAAGAQVLFYRPFRPWYWLLPLLYFPRTHAKLLYVDGDDGYLGSMCMAEYMRDWRDTQVCLHGQLADDAQNDFERLWADMTGTDTLPPHRPDIIHTETTTYVAQHPQARDYPIYRALIEAIDSARHHVRLATPYFFPPRHLRHALNRARARGVEVSLLLSHRTDVALADKVSRTLVGQWRNAGYKVLFYQPTVMHAKYAIIDDHWATLGSCNYDHLSLCFNREANIILRDPQDIAAIAQHFDTDSQQALPSPDRVHNWRDRWIGRFGAVLARVL